MDRVRPALTTPLPGPRPPRLPAARRRRQLTLVAIELFGTQGYHATSMEDIAEEAGVSKPVLYQHFPSKRDLYVELLAGVGRDLSAAVAVAGDESVESSDGTGSPDPVTRRRVRAGFVAYFRFVSEQTAAFQVLFGTGARGMDEFAEVIAGLETEIAAVIYDLIDVGTSAEHRHTLASAIVGAAEMTARHWISSSRTTDHVPGRRLPRLDPAVGDRLAHQLADLMWGGLLGLTS